MAQQQEEVKKIEYRLTMRAINLIIHNKFIRIRIAKALELEDSSVLRILKNNEPNNSLTLSAAIKAINLEVGLAPEEILESIE